MMGTNKIKKNERAVLYWLLLCLLLIFSMVVLGGVTRLTGSGLSMVNWHPIHGLIPPLTPQAWETEFTHYQTSPEFQKINSDMDIEGFKSIFWFEYGHRLLGRLVGLIFLIPFLYFWYQKKIRPEHTPRLILLFFLGGFQGLLGWYMVKSGLINDPHVSQYRLTAHLMSAIIIYALMLWKILDLLNKQAYQPLKHSVILHWRFAAMALTGFVIITIMSGGFVAGLKAGLIYNTFPLMGEQWVPEGLYALSPWYQNLFENKVTVQFNHRILAMLTGVLLLGWYLSGRSRFDDITSCRSFKLIGMMIIIQMTLGISTLLLQVPILLGVLHQAGALVLLSFMLINVHTLSRQ